MIASIVARTCSLVPLDAVDLVCERFDWVCLSFVPPSANKISVHRAAFFERHS